MKSIIILSTVFKLLFVTGLTAANPGISKHDGGKNAVVTQLTDDTFKQLIFDYSRNKEWKYAGTRPAIIDFYADWCGPCNRLSPLVEEIAREYSGQIVVYKVNTDKEAVLSRNLGITGLPTLLFIPAKGKPQASMGLVSRETLVKDINDILLVKQK